MGNMLLVMKGVALGIANIIPGLSGGTVAVVLGIYQVLIDSLASLLSFKKRDCIDSFIFLMLIGVGVVGGVFCFSFIIDWILLHYLESVSFFFIGVILSSIPYIMLSESIQIVTVSRVFLCVLGIVIGISLVMAKGYFFADHFVTDVSAGYLFLSVMIAAATMIIPGISGSLVLVLFGTYSFVIACIKGMVWFDLCIIGVAVLVGIFGCSKLLHLCIKHYFQLTMSLVIGLMLGTMPGIYNGFTDTFIFLNVISFVIGIAVVWSVKIFR